MIDVDTLAVGERALDVANLLVHLELREAQGLLPAELAQAARAGFLSGSGAAELPASRVDAYTRATRLRLRSEEHTSELQSRGHLVCSLLLVEKNYDITNHNNRL